VSLWWIKSKKKRKRKGNKGRVGEKKQVRVEKKKKN